jgi:carbon monoxide dehydrogenase subunit G
MLVDVQVTIQASRPAIWAVLANIEKSADFIAGIDKIEVLEKPASGLG